MVDRAELFDVADAIAAEGRVPSQRLIRERLSKKGSFSDIGPFFVAWCTERNFRPRPTKDDLPKHLGEKLRAIAAEIWADGLREGSIAARNERDDLAAERDSLRLALNEALALVDARNDRLPASNEEATETVRTRRGVSSPDRQPAASRSTLRDLAQRMRDQDEWEPDIEDRAAKG